MINLVLAMWQDVVTGHVPWWAIAMFVGGLGLLIALVIAVVLNLMGRL